jgi:hypothetical protein
VSAFVIMMNDYPEAVVLGSSRQADAVVARLSHQYEEWVIRETGESKLRHMPHWTTHMVKLFDEDGGLPPCVGGAAKL